MDVSVIIPVLNEKDHIRTLIEALSAQTTPPAEIIIADGGSTDGTREIIAGMAAADGHIRLIDGPGGTAENRNTAIASARHDLIACTDAGCVPEPDWLEKLTAPLEQGADWVAGFYRPVGRNATSTAAGLVLMTTVEEVDPERFVPGGSSQAFRRQLWEEVGGFPEAMPAAEDTLFGERLRRAGYRPVFVPEAVVRWSPPSGIGEMVKKAWRWGRADGAARVRRGAYAKVFVVYWGGLVLALVLWWWRWWAGFWVLVGLAGVIALRTQFKYGWAEGWQKYLLIPWAHLLQQLSQSLGWFTGFGPRGLSSEAAQVAKTKLKEKVRPEPPLPVRHNVDLVVGSPAEKERWLAQTPATYRVRTQLPADAGAVVVAHVTTAMPGEPEATALSVTLPAEIGEELGEVTGLDPPTLFHLLRQTGHVYHLIPSPKGAHAFRTDSIHEPSVVVLAAVPLHDVGGGSRGAQLAQELCARGYHVTYVHRYDAAESVDLGLRYIHSRLEEHRASAFHPDSFLRRVQTDQRLVIVEFPHGDHVTTAQTLAVGRYRVIYDLIDDWSDPALGGWWFQPEAERRMIGLANGVVASAPSLVERLSSMTGGPVIEVPNGVNARLFGEEKPLAPTDLPPGEGPVITYHGSLYGNWLDWEAVAAVAEALPEARVVMIGDEKEHRSLPNNVHFLGLKPQAALPAYLSRTDVGLLPFVVSATTHAVSPLKVFEYLAMGVPVAAPPLNTLTGLEGVYTNADLTVAVRAALAAPRPDRVKALRTHGWGQRLGHMLGTVGWLLAPEQGSPVRVVERPVIHYSEAERDLG